MPSVVNPDDRIVEALQKRPMTLSELCAQLGYSTSAVLTTITSARKRGTAILCVQQPDGSSLFELVDDSSRML